MNPVLLHDADEQENAEHGDHAEIEVDRHQHEQRADAGGGKRRQDGDRMDGALVEHAEDDVDGHERGGDEQRLAGERGEKGVGVALEGGDQRLRLSALLLDLPDGVDRVAERHARLQIEGYGRRREQALMVDHDRRRGDVAVDQGAERHLLRGRRIQIDIVERLRAALEARIDLEDDVVLIERGVDRRDDALAEGVAERVVDRRRQDAEARRGIAIDRGVEERSGILLVRRDIGDLRQRS